MEGKENFQEKEGAKNEQTTLAGSTPSSPYLMWNSNCGVRAIQKCIPRSVASYNI